MADEESKAHLFTESKRKKKQNPDEVSNADTDSTMPSTALSEEEETESAATPVDDGMPHPRVGVFFFIMSLFGTKLTTFASRSNLAATSSSARPTSGRRSS